MNLEISIFGCCRVRLTSGDLIDVRGKKHRALICILALSQGGRRSRAELQKMLWGSAAYETGNQNLRRALSDLRGIFGAAFDLLFDASYSHIEIDQSRVSLVGTPEDGRFLQDLDIPFPDFQDWRSGTEARQKRAIGHVQDPVPASIIVLPIDAENKEIILKKLDLLEAKNPARRMGSLELADYEYVVLIPKGMSGAQPG